MELGFSITTNGIEICFSFSLKPKKAEEKKEEKKEKEESDDDDVIYISDTDIDRAASIIKTVPTLPTIE